MALKDILVHADEDGRRDTRFSLAVELAQRHDAHVVGLFALEFPELPGYVSAQISQNLLDRARDTYLAQAQSARDALEAEAERAGVSCEWRQEEGAALELLRKHGRYTDLIVVSQPNTDEAGARPEGFPGELALTGGRPVLTIPYAGAPTGLGANVLIAWNASREAARAVHDAMAFLVNAESVTVLAVDPRDDGHFAGADIATHLARHGVTVEARQSIAPDVAVGDELLNMASDLGSDLLVMGAYGHSRLREAVLGGATQHLLRHMTIPVLMAH
jgi:nucleotide-binding universal stress UspA family protein